MTRRVMIGTPCYDGRIDVWYVNSLCNTIKMSYEHDVDIIPMWVSFDALIQRARNDTVQIAMEMGVDDLIWIDSDIEWKPDWIFKLLDYSYDVVGGTYPKKSDNEEYVYRQVIKRPIDPQTKLMEVDGLGTGFVRMSKKAFTFLWNASPAYIDPKDNKERRMIFDVVLQNIDNVMGLVSEDIHAFNTLRNGGFKIYLDTTMCCNHTGPKKFQGNFSKWFQNTSVLKSTKQL